MGAYFSYGTRLHGLSGRSTITSTTASAHFLVRRHKVPSRGTDASPDEVVFGELGVLRSRTRARLGPAVCLEVKPVGKPDAGNPHVRFDERGRETGRCRMAQATAPVLDSTGAEEALWSASALVRRRWLRGRNVND